MPSRQPPGGATTRPLVGRAPDHRVQCASRAAHERPRGRAAPGSRMALWTGRGGRALRGSRRAIGGPLRPVNSGHRRPALAAAAPRSGPLLGHDNLIPKLMTPRSLRNRHRSYAYCVTNCVTTPPDMGTAPRTPTVAFRAQHIERRRHCQHAHLHVPASPVSTPVASGRRGRLGVALPSWALGG